MTPETGCGIDGNWFEDITKAPLRKQTLGPRTGLLLDLVEYILKQEDSQIFLHLTVNMLLIHGVKTYKVTSYKVAPTLALPIFNLKRNQFCG